MQLVKEKDEISEREKDELSGRLLREKEGRNLNLRSKNSRGR